MATEVLLIAEARIATVQLLEQMLGYLETNYGLPHRFRLLPDLRPEDFTPETFPLIVRAFNPEAHGLAKLLRRNGMPYGFYLDDNFWLLDTGTELGKHYAKREERRRLESVVRGAEVVLASTVPLRDYLHSYNSQVVQLNSFFDFSLIPELPPPPPRRTMLRGGFAASPERVHDLRPLFDEVVDALDEHENLEFELIGVDRRRLPPHPRIRAFPHLSSYSSYIDFQRSRQWDFGLAPLGTAASNPYKTDNKFREYAAQGIPGIYQDAPPYSSVRDGETGLLAGKSRTWRDAIHEYVVDPDLRGRVRQDARKDAEVRCSIENVAPQWLRFFEEAPSLGNDPRSLGAFHRGFGLRTSRLVRAARRGRLLWAYGRKQVADEGLVPTMIRTAGFLWKRVRR